MGSLYWWFTAGPAQLLVAGPEAVLVFFVLSGFVVALPVLRSSRFDWVAYYPRRVVRLYLPIVASILLAIAWILVSHQDQRAASSLWVSSASTSSISWRGAFSATDVLFGSAPLNNPLWSLRWEVTFSLALPIFVVIALGVRKWWWALLLITVPLVLAGQLTGNGSFVYLPVFLAGTVLAVRVDGIRDWLSHPRVARWSGVGGVVVLVLSLTLINLHWEIWGIRPDAKDLRVVTDSVVFIGAFGLVALAAFWRPAIRMLSTKVFRWLGRVSFSLYLVHVPIIVAVGSLIGRGHSAIVIPVSVLVALVVAELFSRFVELPAHRFARAVGRWAARVFADSKLGGP